VQRLRTGASSPHSPSSTSASGKRFAVAETPQATTDSGVLAQEQRLRLERDWDISQTASPPSPIQPVSDDRAAGYPSPTVQADKPIERLRAAFGDEAFECLRTLKRRYDPDNVLRRNRNIPPL
jgi:hypothetical protein